MADLALTNSSFKRVYGMATYQESMELTKKDFVREVVLKLDKEHAVFKLKRGELKANRNQLRELYVTIGHVLNIMAA